MGKTIRFPLERTNLPTMEHRNQDADIIIFPGVRIERREFEQAGRSSRSKRQQAGKKLDQPAFI